MVDPTAIASGVGALASLFGGRKKSRYEQLSEQALAQDMAQRNELMALARGYDPAREDAAAIDYASKSAGKTLAQSLKDVSASFARAGGVPGGDTGILFNLQRSQDSVLNPLSQMMAERKSTQYLRKLQAMQSAIGTARPGELAGQYMQMAQSTQEDPTAALRMLSSSVDALTKKKTPGAVSTVQPSASQPDALAPFRNRSQYGVKQRPMKYEVKY